MALMGKVYSSRRWHLLSPCPTPFSSLSSFSRPKRFSSWSTFPQSSSSSFLSSWPFLHSSCSAVSPPFPLCKPVDKCLFIVVPDVGRSFEKCVCPKCFQIHSLRKHSSANSTKVYIKVCRKAPLIPFNWKKYFCQLLGEEGRHSAGLWKLLIDVTPFTRGTVL